MVKKCKVLGVLIRSDLRWVDNTDYITKKGYERLWILRRLKRLGASEIDLLDVYTKQVLSVLELAVPVWNPGLTIEEIKQIERVQKTAFYIILGGKYLNYELALEALGCLTLKERRENICLKFAKKALKHEKFSNWFVPTSTKPNVTYPNTRSSKSKPATLVEVPYRTDRYRESPLPYLTRLLNGSN